MGKTTMLGRRGFLSGSVATFLAMATPAWAICRRTAGNPEGPFYLPGAPFRTRLAPKDLPGEPLRISGRVTGANGCTPLTGAVLDVWHADADGFYYGVEAPRPLQPEAYTLRGRMRTDADGRYAFDTILPGRYRLGPNWERPRHIHLIVSHPAHRQLTTQIYFAGDPRNQRDPLVKPELIVPLQAQAGGGYQGGFDPVLP